MTIAQILFIFFILVKINCDDQKCSNYLVYDLCNCENGPISFDERYCITCTEPKIIIDNFCYTPVDHCESYSVSEDHCFFCEEGYEMNDKGQCIQCSKGKIGRDNYCFTEIEHCVDYKLFTEGEKCMACEDGYITTKENTKCKEKKIIENCKNTDDENICIECNEEYELYDNGLKCIKKCNELSKIAPFGEYIPRIDSCSIYNSDNTCEKCEENYELKDNSCNECSSGYFMMVKSVFHKLKIAYIKLMKNAKNVIVNIKKVMMKKVVKNAKIINLAMDWIINAMISLIIVKKYPMKNIILARYVKKTIL